MSIYSFKNTNISKFFLIAVIFTIFLTNFHEIKTFSNENDLLYATKMKDILKKALLQCYTLEGQFPENIEYLEKYGVMLDYNKYLYHYEPFGNSIPSIVITKIKK